jgi:hypothetical protein
MCVEFEASISAKDKIKLRESELYQTTTVVQREGPSQSEQLIRSSNTVL